MAFRAFHVAHEFLDGIPGVLAAGFGVTALEIGGDSLEIRVELTAALLLRALDEYFLALRAVHYLIYCRLGYLRNRLVNGESVFLGKGVDVHCGDCALGVVPAGSPYCAAADSESGIRHDEVRVYAAVASQTGALGAGSVGIVEREHSRHQFLDGNSVLRAGVALGEVQFLPVDDIDVDKPSGEIPGGFDTLCQSGFYAVLHYKAVNYYFYGVLLVLLQGYLLGEVVGDPVHAHTGVSGLPGGFELLLVLALASSDHGSQHLELGALRQFHYLIDYLVNGLLLYLSAADGAVRDSDTGVHQSQVVVYLRHSTHGRARILGGGFLVDGDGRGESLNAVYVRFFHLSQEHSRVGGEALHIAALSVRKYRIECQGAFSAAGKPGHYHKAVPREGHVYIFKVVLPGAAYDYLVVCQFLLFLSQGRL